MIHKYLALAAILSLCAGVAGCSSDKVEGSLPPANQGAAQAAPADEGAGSGDMAADKTSGEAMAAESAPAEDAMTEETTTEETTTEIESSGGAMTEETTTEETTTETATAEPAATEESAQQAQYDLRRAQIKMLRDVRDGSYAIRYCEDIDDVTLKTFNDCVTTQLNSADNDGKLTDSYQLGADYQAWVFLGDHAKDLQEKGYEWRGEYRNIYASRTLYQKSVQHLIRKTGLPPDEVCDQLRADCPEK